MNEEFEEPELITPEALEKEPGWYDTNQHRHAGPAKTYANKDLRVQFSNGNYISTYFLTSGYEAHGVTTMPELRLLTTLINGKA